MSNAAAYFAVARQSFRRQSAYRLATAAGAFTNIVFGVVIAATLVAVYAARRAAGTPTVDGLALPGALTLVFVGQAMLMVIAMFGWRDLTNRVRAGEIAIDLQRPVDMSFYWMGHFVGQSAYFVVARGVPPFVAGALLFRLDLPSDPMRWVWFVLSIGGAALVASRWWFLVSLISFWVVGDVRGWLQMSTTLMIFCSGSLIPLQFLPAGIEAIVRRTPFAAMLQLPGEVLLGRWNGAVLLAVQIGWLILLHVIGALTFSIAARRLVIDGG